jgi:hypothetical protein
MPLIKPTEFVCDTCGWTGEVKSSPVHCACGTVTRITGEVISKPSILKRPGDIVEAVAKPIAKAIGKTGCGGCTKRRRAMNAAMVKKEEEG